MQLSSLYQEKIRRFCEKDPTCCAEILAMGKIVSVQNSIAVNLDALSIQIEIRGKIKNIILQRSSGRILNKTTGKMEPFCEFKIITFSDHEKEKSYFLK